MKKTIGIFAHVDAGKTTLSEQILYKTASIRRLGRVDDMNTALDTAEIERQRGITVYSGVARFEVSGNEFFLLDTPGHTDFSAETERALKAIDFGILVVSASEGIQAHTKTLWNLLKAAGKPVFILINKIDRDGVDKNKLINSLKHEFSDCCVDFSDDITEPVAELDEELLSKYLDSGYDEELWTNACRMMILSRKLFPIFFISALKDIGISEFLTALDKLTLTDFKPDLPFSAQIFKVRHDRGVRICFMKILSGKISVKDKLTYCDSTEKINEIRIYNGEKFSAADCAEAGTVAAVCGLGVPIAGDIITSSDILSDTFSIKPMLKCSVIFDETANPEEIFNIFKIFSDEEPSLSVSFNKATRDIQLQVMGKIQLEILQAEAMLRFGANVSFGKCRILYTETIRSEVVGYGHFEPLRHYSEVHLKLTPTSRGSGISFESLLSTDILAADVQGLIRTHVFERQHIGALTGSPITDIKISLIAGRAHIKHTCGGDFRQAVYRAIRQGLFKADTILLEPFYEFIITVPDNCCGRVISDIQRMSGTFSGPEISGSTAVFSGIVPVSEAVDYPAELMSCTKGLGHISFKFGGYDVCHNQAEVVDNLNYDRDADTENTADSVFCSHGAGFNVKWSEAEKFMHLL